MAIEPRLKTVRKVRVYEEIVSQITSLILNGELKMGDKLPSERERGERDRGERERGVASVANGWPRPVRWNPAQQSPHGAGRAAGAVRG